MTRTFAILVAAAVLLLGCTSAPHGLFEEVEKSVHAGPGTTMDLRSAGSDTWDRLCMIGPYVGRQSVDSAFGFHWRGYTQAYQDSHYQIVLLSGDSVEGHVLMRELPIELDQTAPVNCYPRSGAVFRLTPSDYNPAGVKIEHWDSGREPSV